jgi:hypothetical protein
VINNKRELIRRRGAHDVEAKMLPKVFKLEKQGSLSAVCMAVKAKALRAREADCVTLTLSPKNPWGKSYSLKTGKPII